MSDGHAGRPGRTVELFLTETANRLVASHDVHRDERLGGTRLAFLAEYRRRDEKYLLTRAARIWGVENRELLFVTAPQESVSLDFLGRFKEDMQQGAARLVEGGPEHMATVCLGTVVTDRPVVETVAREAVNYRKLKFLRFGLHGWVEMYLAVVDLGERRIDVHPKALPFVEILRRGLGPEGSSRH